MQYLRLNDALVEEEYGLEISEDRIMIKSRNGAGAYHAVSTLNQLVIQYGKELPYMKIEDAPDYKVRGILLDISRDKIPSMETLYELVDFIDLGNYYLKEKVYEANSTAIYRILQSSFEDTSKTDGFKVEDFEGIKSYVAALEDGLGRTQMQCDDAGLIDAEIRNAVRFIEHGCDLGILKLHLKNKTDNMVIKPLLEHMAYEITIMVRKHEDLWLQRNRHGGLNSSVRHLLKLKEEYESQLGRKE